MRVLVTGGAGFIGSHLCDRLLGEDHEVIAMDNLITGSTSNIEHLAGCDDFLFIKHDVTDYIYVDGPLDAILHLASLPSPVDYLQEPIKTLKVGALGTHKTLGLARAKSARYLLTSTSEVYGDPQVHPQPESYWGHVNPVGPRGVYDESKRFAEAMVMAYHRYHGIDTRIARIFNCYGPRMRLDDGRVVPNFIGQALRGEALTVYGDGSQTRAFCYIDDMVEGLYQLLMSSEIAPVNLGNPREMTILQLAHEVLRVTGSCSQIALIHPQDERIKDDPQVRQPDISKARQILGWEPRVPLDEGLRRTVRWFHDKL